MSSPHRDSAGDPEPALAPANENLEQPIATPANAVPAKAPRKSRAGRYALMAALPLALAAGGGYAWATGGRIQETDNANLRQARIAVAAEEGGRIVSTNVSENAAVQAGDIMFTVDAEPYRIGLAEADAALAGARLSIEQLRATYSRAEAETEIATRNLDFLRSELARQTELSRKGIVTRSALDTAERDVANAEQQQIAARQGIAAALAALGGDPKIAADAHPTVLSAIAAREKAAYALSRTVVRAPANGVLSQAASFKVGQYVTTGTPLFTLVETGESWVEANFKETQLTHMAVGQSAEIVLDAFPDRPLHATVESIGAGTGAEFALLPAQNATGNWVKVTQRIPVRLRVEKDAEPLLRTGMSATVSVDTGQARGFGDLFAPANAAER